MKFLFAPWGNPVGWRKTRYIYGKKEIEAPDPLNLIREVENPEYTVILSLDTLADNQQKNFSNYGEVVETARCEIVRFINNHTIFADEIVILPGTGTFKNRMEFSGNPEDVYYSALYKLGEYILGKLKNGNRENSKQTLEVILDITHGINYQMMLIYKALFEISQILAYFYDVVFSVLNSDPFVPGVQKPLNIHEIERIKVVPRFVMYKYDDMKLLRPADFLDKEEKGNIGRETEGKSKELSKIAKDDILWFGSAFMYALPLWVIYFMPDPAVLKDELGKLFMSYRSFITVSQRRVERKAKLMPHTANVIKVWMIAELLKRARFYERQKEKLSSISVKCIKGLNELLYAKYFPVEYNRIHIEIEESEKQKQEYLQRNFFAHAGFIKHKQILKKDDDEYTVDVDKVNEIKNILRENLPTYPKEGEP